MPHSQTIRCINKGYGRLPHERIQNVGGINEDGSRWKQSQQQTVKEIEDGKAINTRQYSMNLQANDSNEIKIGTRVPVETGQSQFQYIDVGTNIWCRIGERSEGVPLSVRAEISNFAIPDQSSGHESRPVIRQLQIKASTLPQLGKPMVVGSVDDPNSKRQFQLEVTVNKLH